MTPLEPDRNRPPQRSLADQAMSAAMDLLGRVDPKLLRSAGAFFLKAQSARGRRRRPGGGPPGPGSRPGGSSTGTGSGGFGGFGGGSGESGGFGAIAGQLGDLVRDPSALRDVVGGLRDSVQQQRRPVDLTAGPVPKADGVLSGVAASAGTGQGTARVVSGDVLPAGLGAGDVVVCRSIANAWAGRLDGVAGVVFETGGAGSVAMRACRAQKIAAVRLDGATTRIAEGARVSVDGGTGRVTLAPA